MRAEAVPVYDYLGSLEHLAHRATTNDRRSRDLHFVLEHERARERWTRR